MTLSPWAFKKGEQFFENYGQPNHIYFTYHGFVLDDNSHDCVVLPLGADAITDEDAQARWHVPHVASWDFTGVCVFSPDDRQTVESR